MFEAINDDRICLAVMYSSMYDEVHKSDNGSKGGFSLSAYDTYVLVCVISCQHSKQYSPLI